MSKKVCLAGGAGFLGSHLLDRLLERNDVENIVIVDNFWTGLAENFSHVKDERVAFERRTIETLPGSNLFDEVYHLASPASPPWYMADPVHTISANVGGALRLLELLKPGGKFCYTSSSEVYGDPQVSPQPESYLGSVDCTGPRSAYDEGKRCTEALLFGYQRTSGLDLRVVRPFNVYGPRTRVDDGRAVSNFISHALNGRPIKVYGDGSQTRSWGYVDDVIDGFTRYFWEDNIDYAGPLNIGNDTEISVLEIAHYVADLIPGSKIVHGDPVPQDPTNRRPDLTLANQHLPGWTCKTDYKTGIRKTLEWFKKNMIQENFGSPDFLHTTFRKEDKSPKTASI